jgi:hypothetical protein
MKWGTDGLYTLLAVYETIAEAIEDGIVDEGPGSSTRNTQAEPLPSNRRLTSDAPRLGRWLLCHSAPQRHVLRRVPRKGSSQAMDVAGDAEGLKPARSAGTSGLAPAVWTMVQLRKRLEGQIENHIQFLIHGAGIICSLFF